MPTDQLPKVTGARQALARVLRPGDSVAANLAARNLAAYFPNRFDYIGNADGHAHAWTITPTNWQPTRTTYTVAGAGGSTSRGFNPIELQALSNAVDAGLVEVIYRGPDAIIVKARRSEHSPR